MVEVIVYTFVSVILVSLVSFAGALTLLVQLKHKERFLLFLVSLSAGTLFGDAFLHLLPEALEKKGLGVHVSLVLLAGIVVFFVLEKIIHWHHCHGHAALRHPDKSMLSNTEKKVAHDVKPMVMLNLMGDGIHNFLDGMVIAGSYLVSVPIGIATTIAVVFHEIPQEIADFGVLVYGGLSKRKALFLNFLSGAVAIAGAGVGLWVGIALEEFVPFLLLFAAGGFIYIAGSNLIPELHKECGAKDSFEHLIALLLGIGIMVVLKMVG